MLTPSSTSAGKRLCVGIVTGPHGVRGAVRVKSFTGAPGDIGAYGPVTDEAGTRRFAIRVTGEVKGVVIVELEGVADRTAAEGLKGLHLYVDRAQLPPADDEEYYHADLIGLDAVLLDGQSLGTVTMVHEYGAGDSLEILRPDGETILVPFTKAAVPTVDLAGNRLVIDPPDGLFEKPAPPARLDSQAEAAASVLERGTP